MAALVAGQRRVAHYTKCQNAGTLPILSASCTRFGIKRTRQPSFVLAGNICALLAAKDHVNIFLYDGRIVPDPAGIITGGHTNKTGRTVAVRQGDALNGPALRAMFQHIIANNRAGGWRKLKSTR